LLKNKLQSEYPHVNFEVINLGISAVNTITIREIIDDVLEENPDLILFYAGHNEYYGALGPASNVSGLNIPFITRLVLDLKEFRTVQLLENLIGNTISALSKKSQSNKTLMSEMAGKNLVPLNSDKFNSGVTQFESNLEYILSRCVKEKVQIMVGTLTSNLMQYPLCKFAGCDSLSVEFNKIINDSLLATKENLYNFKEKDELRFRAPQIFNDVIFRKSIKYNCAIFDVKKEFEKNSPNGIIGKNLMLDHLHPNFEGNSIIATILFGLIKKNEKLYLLASRKILTPELTSFPFRTYTDLDSSFANLRIKYLKGDFPFVEEKDNSLLKKSLQSLEDSTAQEIVDGKISWENAHLKLAEAYFNKKDFSRFMEEINVLIEDKPFDKFPYVEAMKYLEKVNKTDFLKYILHKYYKIYPELFAANKLGDIYFNESKHSEAIFYYEKCVVEKSDPRIFFNLSACYFAKKDLDMALKSIRKCLEKNPNYPNANKIYSGLLNIRKSKK